MPDTARDDVIDMGIFRTSVSIAHLARPTDLRDLSDVMVDSGSEYTWVPAEILDDLGVERRDIERFESADGRVLTRDIGWAIAYAGGRGTPTIVVFAGPGDMMLLGAVALEGLNLRVDLVRRELVPGGPVPAAAAA